MRSLNLTKRWNGSRLESFYCRVNNRLTAEGCPRAAGPRGCPLRQECPPTPSRAPRPGHGRFPRPIAVSKAPFRAVPLAFHFLPAGNLDSV